MNQANLQVVEPDEELKAQFLAMCKDFHQAGESRYDPVMEYARKDFSAYVKQLGDNSRGIGLPSNYVPSTALWLTTADRSVVLGAGSLRHRLIPALEKEGGHIGYAIRPSERRKGYGTRMLALMLQKAGELGLTRVLVTCDTDNIASARVIQKNGGMLDGSSVSIISGKSVSRYWIDLL